MNQIERNSKPDKTDQQSALGNQAKVVSWRRLPQQSLSENIIAQIRHELFSGQLKPGDYLGTEASLSESFGVSRVATRDAVRALHASGVIESRRGSGGGIRIAHGDPDRFADALAIQLKLVGVSVKEIVDAHVTIETAAAELAATYGTAADHEKLERQIKDLGKAVADGDMDGYIVHLLSFHLTLAETSHNRALSTLLKGYFDVLEDFYRSRANPATGRRILRYCHKILAALRQKDRELTRLTVLELFRPLLDYGQ